jgi:hypothetical protein
MKKFTTLIFVSLIIFAPIIFVIFIARQPAGAPQPQVAKIVAKVGDENIYQSDLNYELSLHPQKNDPNIKKILLEKIASDSVILQGASEDKIVTLNSSIYNSPQKEYPNRIKTVQSAKEILKKQSDSIKGKVVSLWFNNDWISPLGIEQSKKIAKEKITDLQQQVKNKQITIDEAGEKIKNDPSLAQIDPAYQFNAIYEFTRTPDDQRPISLNKDFNTLFWQLNVGDATDVFAVRTTDMDTGVEDETLYIFGQLTDKISTGNVSYEKWYQQKSQKYAIKYY